MVWKGKQEASIHIISQYNRDRNVI